MDSLVPALIAVLLSEIGSKTQGFARNLVTAGHGSAAISSLLLTSLIGYGIAAAAGVYVGQLIAFEARTLLFGVALLAAGLPMLVTLPAPPVMPEPVSLSRTVFTFARTQFGDSAQFIIFALAAKAGGLGAFLSIPGALFGLFAAIGVAIMAGPHWPEGVRLRGIRAAIGAILAISGFLISIRALGLVAT